MVDAASRAEGAPSTVAVATKGGARVKGPGRSFGSSRRGDGGKRAEVAGGVARRDSSRRPGGGRGAEAHRLRDLVAAFAAAGAQGVDGGDVR